MRKSITSFSALILGIVSVLVFNKQPAAAEVIYTDIEPDITISEWDAYLLEINPEWQLDAYYFWKHPTSIQVNSYYDYNQLYFESSLQYPEALDYGTILNHDSPYWRSFTMEYVNLNNEGTEGVWIGKYNKYLGLRVLKDGDWYYGWARLDIPADYSYFTIKDYAYESTPNSGIVVGDIPAGIDDELQDNFDAKIFSSDIGIFISPGNNVPYNLEIYNLSGQQIYNSTCISGEISVQGLYESIYFLVFITNDRKHYIKKFLNTANID